MNRDERMAARAARLEQRRAEREASARNISPPARLTRSVPRDASARKPCGCNRSKG